LRRLEREAGEDDVVRAVDGDDRRGRRIRG
jgi:hypothetical protein